MDEFEALQAIFPEATIKDGKRFSIAIPVHLETPIQVVSGDKSALVSDLPPLTCSFTVAEGYPETKAPYIALYGAKAWLSHKKQQEIKHSLLQTWESMRDSIIYIWIDELKLGAETAYGVTSPLEVSKPAYDIILKASGQAEQQSFDRELFSCGICLNSHSGKDCIRFDSCQHVFCKPCLESFFTENIERGEVDQVHCPDFECTKKYVQQDLKDVKGPGEQDVVKFEQRFFEVPIDRGILEKTVSKELIDRYLHLYRQSRFEKYAHIFPERVLQCPWKTCGKPFLLVNKDSQMAECPYCGFAFCRSCLHSWHGENNACGYIVAGLAKKVAQQWMESEPDSQSRSILIFKFGQAFVDKAVREYLDDQMFDEWAETAGDAMRCPMCKVVVEKIDGCNMITCGHCRNFFCYLCGESLNPGSSPYNHFNDPDSLCYGKLFEGMPGAEDVEDGPQ